MEDLDYRYKKDAEPTKLYSVTNSGIENYNPIKCNFSGLNCSENCILFKKEDKSCTYCNSLSKLDYRKLDNEVLFKDLELIRNRKIKKGENQK